MYDIITNNVKKGKEFFLLFFIVGILILVIMLAIVIFGYVRLNSLDSKTTSRRVVVHSYYDEGERVYSPIYYYTVDGKNYSCSNSSSDINPGTTNKTVYYDSKDPSKCTTDYSKSSYMIVIIAMLLPLLSVIIAVVNMRKISKRIKKIEELNQIGKLVKNLPYRLENSNMSVNDVPIQKPVVDYVLPSGSVITLYGDSRHDGKYSDADGMVDLVIDESNPDNYFIDFEINRLSGNLPTDFYTLPQNVYPQQYDQNSISNQNIQQ